MRRILFFLLPALATARLHSAEAVSPQRLEFTYAGPFVCDGEHLNHMENFAVPKGDYGKLVLDMDVTTGPGPWNSVNPRGWHDLFWLVRTTRNLYMFGYAALRKDGDHPPEAMLRQGWGVQHPKKSKDIQEIAIAPNTTYHINYVFDAAGGHAALTLSTGGKEVKRIETVPLFEPPARRFSFGDADKITIGLSTAIGFNKAQSPETPSLGWTYRDLRIVLDPTL